VRNYLAIHFHCIYIARFLNSERSGAKSPWQTLDVLTVSPRQAVRPTVVTITVLAVPGPALGVHMTSVHAGESD
jgi:hypothetical protein